MTKKLLNFSEICSRYAKALISLHGDDDKLESVFKELLKIIELKNESKELSNDIVNQIQKLNELYKDGSLTKDEFEKAKKKILN